MQMLICIKLWQLLRAKEYKTVEEKKENTHKKNHVKKPKRNKKYKTKI